MLGDTVECYRGREAEWAALCALDGFEATQELPDPLRASALIKAVWEFVDASCEEAGQATPDPEEATEILATMILERETLE